MDDKTKKLIDQAAKDYANGVIYRIDPRENSEYSFSNGAYWSARLAEQEIADLTASLKSAVDVISQVAESTEMEHGINRKITIRFIYELKTKYPDIFKGEE